MSAELGAWLGAYKNYEKMRVLYTDLPDKAWFFRRIVETAWGEKNGVRQFIWHPWAETMNEVCHAHTYSALNGCASSGKTDFAAIFAIVNWWCDPENTLVLVTTTGIADAKRRIWGAIEKYFMAAPGLPGKLVASVHEINTIDDRGNKHHGQSGIVLVAGEKKKEKEALGKLIGSKAARVILVADELPELSEAILETALSNLTSNPYFQMIGIGNFKSRYDPFGTYCEPKAGYDSITIDTLEWETKLGWCARFDGMKSPNILEGRTGKDAYPIYGAKQYKEHRDNLGENSASFWRMCRSFEPRIGADDCIYSESDLVAGNAYGGCVWAGEPVAVSGLDPSFTNGGDRCVQWIGKWGLTTEGISVLRLEKRLLLREDVRVIDQTRNFQIARRFIENCVADGVKPQFAGMDTTGAGAVLYDIVCELWKTREVLPVDFSGAPSEMQVRVNDQKTAKDSYDRKVTELWYIGHEFVKHKQIRGMTASLGRELKARKYDTVKGAEGLKIRAETKSDMKERLGFSPDEADAFAVTLHVVRERLGALAGTVASGMASVARTWSQQNEAAARVYQNANYEPEKVAA